MTESEFLNLAKQGYNRIPVVLETFADLDTPLSIYLKLANKPYSYLLESVHGGEQFGRYSFIGLPASIRIEIRGSNINIFNEKDIKEFKEKDEEKQLKLSELWDRITGFKTSLSQIFVLSLMLQAFAIAAPFYMQLTVDDVVVSNDLDLMIMKFMYQQNLPNMLEVMKIGKFQLKLLSIR